MTTPDSAAQAIHDRAQFVKDRMPDSGLFAGQTWRISPDPFLLKPEFVKDLEFLGRVLVSFYRAINLLYRQSVEGLQPSWIAELLDQGKPSELIEWQRSPRFKGEIPRVIRPDILLTEDGFTITELDSVPGGIGVTSWLNETYADLAESPGADPEGNRAIPGSSEGKSSRNIIGGRDGLWKGFQSIFPPENPVHIVVSDESKTYRPEMEWLARKCGDRFQVRDGAFREFKPNDSVYRFFELFDLTNVSNAEKIIHLARQSQVFLTPPPKPILEEKMWLALLWNRNLRPFWHQQLGESFLARLQKHVPYSWVVDPTPLPPHGAFPEINLTDWNQLKQLSQKERDLILKISGYSEKAWGARGVYLGSDLPQAEWSKAVDEALQGFPQSPYILQRYIKPKNLSFQWYDFEKKLLQPMPSRVRLCPYYFVQGQGDALRPELGGILATVCPAQKKIIHGMTDAVLVPCAVA